MEEPIQLQPIQQVALVVKNLMANSGDIRDEAPSLGREDPLEKELETHSSILAWKPTPVLLPGESHGQRSLRLTDHGGHKELDTIE